jgi:hypothetical protein
MSTGADSTTARYTLRSVVDTLGNRQTDVLAPHAGAVTVQVASPQHETGWLDVLSAWAWPLAVVFLAIAFHRQLRELFTDVDEWSLGPFGAKRRRQGREAAPPAVGPVPPPPPRVSAEANELLCTLWSHQRKHFGTDLARRWTFLVNPAGARYPAFLTGLAEMVNVGLVAVSPKTLQCFLTNAGVLYCQRHETELHGDFWDS